MEDLTAQEILEDREGQPKVASATNGYSLEISVRTDGSVTQHSLEEHSD